MVKMTKWYVVFMYKNNKGYYGFESLSFVSIKKKISITNLTKQLKDEFNYTEVIILNIMKLGKEVIE